MTFVHLHNHTEYSLLDGAAKIKDLVARAADYAMPACAITDHGVMYGVIDFYQACLKKGVKPIIGCEVYVCQDRFSRSGRKGDNACHLVLLAENDQGYRNLCRLVSLGFLEGFYYKPRVDHELLRQYHEGLICLSACIGGEVPEAILSGQLDQARTIAADYLDIFGRDNFFIELQDHGLSEEKTCNPYLRQIASELGVGLVCTNDLHYVDASDSEMHDILLCIQTGKLRSDENRMRFANDQFYMKTESEMAALFADCPEALANTVAIAERCQVKLDFDHLYMPVYQVPAGYDLNSYLRKLCEDGLRRRYDPVTDELRQRMDYELGVIAKLDYPGYFLIVWDMIEYARSQGISVGPGRGSAAGSLVAYCLGITDIDPIRWGLLFERFLNPERVSPPDIDTDISDLRRGEVVDYLVRKYGADKVSQIITFNFMLMKGAVKSVGRVLDVPYADADRIVKLMPEPPELKEAIRRRKGEEAVPNHPTVMDAVEFSPELQAEYDNDPLIREMLDIANKIQGMPSHCGKHAAGVAIAQQEVVSYMPVQMDNKDGSITTQYAKEQVEKCGLVKMDLLGLRTLSVLDDAVENIYKTHKVQIELDKIPLNDPATFAMLSQGDTSAVFQLESEGMRKYLRDLQPERFEDIIAMVALYRPGPLGSGMVEQFISGRHGRRTKYLHSLLEPILQETYGVILYQEQVMEIVRALGGFTLGRSDTIRRAMGKKKMSVIEEAKEDFVRGCEANGLQPKLAEEIFELLKKFGEYGFNKSHSAAYAMVAYETAWLKANYPPEFMAATMTSVMDAADKVPKYIRDCRAMGITVLPPDINESGEKFNVTGDKIRFALTAVKNVGREAVRGIVEERENNGPYASLTDFCQRQQLNKKMLESLIRCGALDSLGGNRASMLASLDRVLDLSKRLAEDRAAGQMSLFDLGGGGPAPELKLVQTPEFPFKERLNMEKETLGFYVSGHPFDPYRPYVEKKVSHDVEGLLMAEDKTEVTVAGIISSIQRRLTKTDKPMAILTLEDEKATVRCTLFPKDYEKFRDQLFSGQAVLLRGKVKANNGTNELSLEQVSHPCKLFLRLPSLDSADLIREVKNQLLLSPGHTPVEAYYQDSRRYAPFPGASACELNKDLLTALADRIGPDNVAIK